MNMFLYVCVFKMFGHSSAQLLQVSTCLDVILHVRHRHSRHVIASLSYLCVRCSVDKLGPQGVRWGSLGPCDHGRTGAGLQGWRCYPRPGCLAQGLVVGQGGRQGGLVPLQLCEGKWTTWPVCLTHVCSLAAGKRLASMARRQTKLLTVFVKGFKP